MEKQSKRRSRPMPDAGNIKNITIKLQKALSNEDQFDCNYSDRKPWEVTMPARDAAVQVMRFLKFWFDLPETVFFTTVNYLDIFLARMKVQEKFLPCLSISCFYLAAQKHGFEIDAHKLVTLSQSKCSVKDMERMIKIINQKLNVDDDQFCNTLDLLQIYMNIFKYVAVQFKIEGLLTRMLQWQQLSLRFEVLMCDSLCACFKPSILALAFIHFEMERFLSREIPRKSNYYTMEMFYVLAVMIELQSLCNISSNDYTSCFDAVSKSLKRYDTRKKLKNCQKLSWKFSSSTYALCEYSHRYSILKTITEE